LISDGAFSLLFPFKLAYAIAGMSNLLLFSWFGILLCAAASFFFALAETALFALGQWQAREMAQRHEGAGQGLARLLEQPQDLLATIVLGNTLANGIMVAIVLDSVPQGDPGLWWRLLALLVLILFGCEVAPKALAVRDPKRMAALAALFITGLMRLMRPVQRSFQWINTQLIRLITPKNLVPLNTLSDGEYQELLEMAFQQGTLAQSEKEIILQIISLDRRTARDVMRPRSQVAFISDEASVAEMLETARKHRHRRLLMYDETPDTIVGVLNARALLLNPEVDISEVIEFPSFVPATMGLLPLLKALQRQQRGLAVVLDEFGGLAGVVTMADILQEIVGSMVREGEPEGFVMAKLAEGRWRVSGTMRLEDFRREYPELGEVPEVDTLGGLALLQLEVVPPPGTSFVWRGLRMTVTVADDRRVRELLVEKISAAKTKGTT
jgi:CBS domain containing-hemolysin-like protein